MRISNILILGLMVLASACSTVNIKPDSDIAVRENGHPFAYWFTTTGGCRVAHEHQMDNYTFEWSGRCENGLVTGCGQLLSRLTAANGAVIETMDGCFSKGLKNGKFRKIIPLARERDTFKIEYVDGLAVSYAKESPSPPSVPQRLPDDPKTVGRGARG